MYLTRNELDIRDDDTLIQKIKFFILSHPKFGRLEHVLNPG